MACINLAAFSPKKPCTIQRHNGQSPDIMQSLQQHVNPTYNGKHLSNVQDLIPCVRLQEMLLQFSQQQHCPKFPSLKWCLACECVMGKTKVYVNLIRCPRRIKLLQTVSFDSFPFPSFHSGHRSQTMQMCAQTGHKTSKCCI